MSNSALLSSSLVKKYWMALTGLFLCLFLVGHLLGNLQLMLPMGDEAKDQFNAYALFMTTNPLVKVLSWVTYISILFHAIDGIALTIQNKRARKVKYARENAAANSSWASRNMAMLGTLLLFYIVSHMAHFWWRMHYGEIEAYNMDGQEVKDLYTVVMTFFRDGTMGLVWTLVYVVSMIFIAFHLAHGFQSAFQSLGIRHSKFTPIIRKVGIGFAVLIPAGFAIIPIWIRFML